MKIGDKIFYYEKVEQSSKIQGMLYTQYRGKIIKIFENKKSITANTIQKYFGLKPGDIGFSKVYTMYLNAFNQKKAIFNSNCGKVFLILERVWENGKFGDDKYTERIPNSIDFILGGD